MADRAGEYFTTRRDFEDLTGKTYQELIGRLLKAEIVIDEAVENPDLINDLQLMRVRGDTVQIRAVLERRPEYNPGTGDQFVSALREKACGNKLELQKWADFVATDHGSAPYTVDGLAPDCGLVAFHGRGKGGKTTLLIHGARAIAAGAPFLDRATTQKPVLYVNYEMGFSYLKELLSAGGPCPDDAYILNRPEPVLQVVTVGALMQQVGKPGVLVIDSFRGAFRLAGDAENSAGGAGLILRNLQDLAVAHKWLVIVVHHSNRSQREGTDGVSGTSDWIAAPDVIWTWQRPDKAKPGVLHIEGRMPPVDPLAVDLAPEKCVFVGSVEESQKATDEKAILAALTQEGQTADVIAETIDRPAGTVRKRCEALFEVGKLNRAGEGKRGDPHLYSKVLFPHEISLSAETNPSRPNGHRNGLVQPVFATFGGGQIVKSERV